MAREKVKARWFAAFVSGRLVAEWYVWSNRVKGLGEGGPRMIKPPRDGNFSCPIINYRAALPPHARDQCVTSYEKNFSRYYN